MNYDSDQVIITEINEDIKQSSHNLEKVDKVLFEIWNSNKSINMYKIDANTNILIDELVEKEMNLSLSSFAIDIKEWLKENIQEPDLFMKLYISYQLYKSFSKNNDALRCAEMINEQAKQLNNSFWQGIALNLIGLVYERHMKFQEALDLYQASLDIFNKLEKNPLNLSIIASRFNNIGKMYKELKLFDKALTNYQKAKNLFEQCENFKGLATVHNNIGLLYNILGRSDDSHEYLIYAYEYSVKSGDLYSRANRLNSIIGLLEDQGEDSSKLVNLYENVIKISKNLGTNMSTILFLENLGTHYENKNKYPEAIDCFKKALEIAEKENFNIRKINYSIHISELYYKQELYEDALEFLKIVIKFKQESGSEGDINRIMNNIGNLYVLLDKDELALKYFNDALQLSKKLKNIYGQIESLYNKGLFYQNKKKYQKGFEFYQFAYNLYKSIKGQGKSNDYVEIDKLLLKKLLKSYSDCLYNLGDISYKNGNLSDALKLFKKILPIDDKLENYEGKAIVLNNMGCIYADLRNLQDALKKFNEALETLKQNNLRYISLTSKIENKIFELEKQIHGKNAKKKKKKIINNQLNNRLIEPEFNKSKRRSIKTKKSISSSNIKLKYVGNIYNGKKMPRSLGGCIVNTEDGNIYRSNIPFTTKIKYKKVKKPKKK